MGQKCLTLFLFVFVYVQRFLPVSTGHIFVRLFGKFTHAFSVIDCLRLVEVLNTHQLLASILFIILDGYSLYLLSFQLCCYYHILCCAFLIIVLLNIPDLLSFVNQNGTVPLQRDVARSSVRDMIKKIQGQPVG